MEREYTRIRNAEKRYRLLFQFSAEPALIVDAHNQRVLELNPSAAALFGEEARRCQRNPFADLFDDGSRQAVQSFVAAARLAPRVDNVHVESGARPHPRADLRVALSPGEPLASSRAALARRLGVGGARSEGGSQPLAYRRGDAGGLRLRRCRTAYLSANSAFLDLAQISGEAQARGELIERWIGRPGVDVDVLFANLSAYGVVRHFSTVARGEFGSNEDVEIAGVAVPEGGDPVSA